VCVEPLGDRRVSTFEQHRVVAFEHPTLVPITRASSNIAEVVEVDEIALRRGGEETGVESWREPVEGLCEPDEEEEKDGSTNEEGVGPASGATDSGQSLRRFQRALQHGTPWVAEAEARDLHRVSLEDRFRLVYLDAEKESPKYARVAMKWLRRDQGQGACSRYETPSLDASIALAPRERSVRPSVRPALLKTP
jgi:hypothetical protein